MSRGCPAFFVIITRISAPIPLGVAPGLVRGDRALKGEKNVQGYFRAISCTPIYGHRSSTRIRLNRGPQELV